MNKWIMDPSHCVAAFTVRHLLVTNVRGQFNTVSGTFFFDPEDIAHSALEATIDVTAIYTGVQKRDAHLLNPDFLDAENYPNISFRSNGMEKLENNCFRVKGDLTIRGVTRPLTLEAQYYGPVQSPFGGETVMGFTATTTINRFDFGVSWNEGGMVVGKDVEIILDIEADLTK